MANIKQQLKRIKTNEKARVANVAFRSSLKSAVKAVDDAVQNNNKAAAVEANQVAFKKLDKALAKGLVHKNYVARKKSQLSKAVNSVQ